MEKIQNHHFFCSFPYSGFRLIVLHKIKIEQMLLFLVIFILFVFIFLRFVGPFMRWGESKVPLCRWRVCACRKSLCWSWCFLVGAWWPEYSKSVSKTSCDVRSVQVTWYWIKYLFGGSHWALKWNVKAYTFRAQYCFVFRWRPSHAIWLLACT